MFKPSPPCLSVFAGMHLTPPPPQCSAAAGGAGRGPLIAAAPTSSPRASHALFCSASWQLSGSCVAVTLHAPHCCMVTGSPGLPLAPRLQNQPRIGYAARKAALPLAAAACAGCSHWSGSIAPAPWRLGECKHPGFIQRGVFTSSAAFACMCRRRVSEEYRVW